MQPDTEFEPWRKGLLDAAKIVRERWQQGNAGLRGGPRCAVGAISEACGIDGYMDASNALRNALPNPWVNLHNSISGWNDAPGRTKEEVAELMERVAMSKPEEGNHAAR